MGTFCDNFVCVRTDHVDAFREAMNDTMDFNLLIPYPTKLAEMDADYPDWGEPDRDAKLSAYRAKWGVSESGYNLGGWRWALDHWGTRHNAYCDVGGYWDTAKDNPHETWISFETSSTPCTPVIEALAKKFPFTHVMYVYSNEEDRYCGCVVWHNGKEVYSKEVDDWEYDRDGSAGGCVEPVFNDNDAWG